MILKEVRKNKINSYFIISVFIIAIMLIVYFVCIAFDLGPISAIIALLFASISAIASYYSCDKIVLGINNARPATESQDKLLSTVLDNLCIASGLTRPKLYVIEDSSPNAFATGRNPETSVICVTTGLLEEMNKYELEGVLAHELSHIKNYDILLSTVVSVFVGFVVILADVIFRASFFRRDSDDNGNSGIILQLIGIVFLLLSPLFATLMQLAISRKREFLADSSSVEITRNPEGLISALEKLSKNDKPLEAANKATAHMYITNPFKNEKKRNLFSTHPPIEERIKHLQNIN
ncbi:MAG: M48 family metallopeptidase [Clostridia bacterium]